MYVYLVEVWILIKKIRNVFKFNCLHRRRTVAGLPHRGSSLDPVGIIKKGSSWVPIGPYILDQLALLTINTNTFVFTFIFFSKMSVTNHKPLKYANLSQCFSFVCFCWKPWVPGDHMPYSWLRNFNFAPLKSVSSSSHQRISLAIHRVHVVSP